MGDDKSELTLQPLNKEMRKNKTSLDVNLTLTNPRKGKIFVKTPEGEKLTLFVYNDTIKDVKAKIFKKKRIAIRKQRLSHKGELLKDSFHICPGATLTLTTTGTRRRRLTNQRLINRFIRESIRCQQS